MKALVTGAAGFIGAAVAEAMIIRGDIVIGVDNLNDYYDVNLKHARLKHLGQLGGSFDFRQIDVTDVTTLQSLFRTESFDVVIHLAAQAGVRDSINNPMDFVQNNLVGFTCVLEACRKYPVKHLVYASSSSVYGHNNNEQFSIDDRSDHPVSFYAATKKANELMAHSYAHLYKTPTTGLRFFTVFGPWGRPDMAPMLFANSILSGKPIQIFNNGNMKRDFIFIDDIVNGVLQILEMPPHKNPIRNSLGGASLYHDVFNIGRGESVDLLEFISILEQTLGRVAIKEFKGMQSGDVPMTCADISRLAIELDYTPQVSIEEGVSRFGEWFKLWHKRGSIVDAQAVNASSLPLYLAR
jgi:UDP-glucuronate 4-epimerase